MRMLRFFFVLIYTLMALLVIGSGLRSECAMAADVAASGVAGPLFTANHAVNLRAVGAKLDGRSVTDLNVSRGSAIVRSQSAHFTSNDAGKLIIICAAADNGPIGYCQNTYTGRILSVQSPAQATLASQYTEATQSRVFAFFASDDTAALQAAIDATGSTRQSRTGVIELPGRPAMISRPLLFENKSIEFAGQGMFGTIVGDNPGTVLVWAGPAGVPMIRVLKCYGLRIHDLNLMGNSNPAHQPSALIQLENPARPALHPDSFNRFYNIHGGSSYSINNPGNGVQAVAGIKLISAVNNDRNMFDNVRFDSLDVGYDNENQMGVNENLSNFTCFNCGTEIKMAHGGDVDIVNLEALAIGTIFDIGRGARVVVDLLDSENSSRLQVGKSQFVRFEAGGGSLKVAHGNFSLSCSIPANGVIVDTVDNSPAALMLSDFTLTSTALCPPTVRPVIRFKANGTAYSAQAQRYFVCSGCRGLNNAELDVNPTGHDQLDVNMIAIRSRPYGPGDTGSDTFNLLQGPGGVYDPFRRDVPGKLNVMGGPLTVRQLVPPQFIYVARCSTAAGGKTYYYRVTARSGAAETIASPENKARCAYALSDRSYVQLQWFPVAGADSYGVYRGDAPGAERLIAVVPANRFSKGVGFAGYEDTGKRPIGGPAPRVNTTGVVSVAGAVQLGPATAASLGSLPDGSEVYCRDCRSAGGEGANCLAGGAGQLAVRVAHVWKCF